MVPSPEVPIRTHSTPMSLNIAVQGSQTVPVHSEASELSPDPSRPAMVFVVVMVAPPQMPILANDAPMTPIPTLVHAQAVQMSTNSTGPTPEPSGWAVELVLPPHVPVRSNAAPMPVVVLLQNAQAILMVSNALVGGSPNPAGPSMKAMAVVVPLPQSPIAASQDPAGTGPPEQFTGTVQMVPNAAVAAPAPHRPLIVMVFPPQMPVGSDSAPMSLVVAVQSSQPISMQTDPPEATPDPLGASVQAMTVMVSPDQVPVATNCFPTGASPTSQDPQAVEVPTNPAM